LFRRGQLYACATRFGKADGDRLLRGASAVLAFADVVHFFAYELACLGAGGLSFLLVFVSPVNDFLFWHFGLLVFDEVQATDRLWRSWLEWYAGVYLISAGIDCMGRTIRRCLRVEPSGNSPI
jgi:hypothetical protein